jgi:hypothetical protein
VRIDELCQRDRAACLRAQERNRFDEFDTQAADRDVRLIGRLHGPTPLAADNGDPSTYLWAACFSEDVPKVPVREPLVRNRWLLAWRRGAASTWRELWHRGEALGRCRSLVHSSQWRML